MLEIEQLELFGALELGIIPPSHNISKNLQSLGCEESNIARRKFRKVKRRLLAKLPNDKLCNSEVRALVKRQCVLVGEQLLAGQIRNSEK